MTHDATFVYEAAPEIAILDILDATLDIANLAMNAANPIIKTHDPYWINAALGPAYELEDRIGGLQAAIGHYRSTVTKLLPPDPDLEDCEPKPPAPDEKQLPLPF